MNCEQFEELAGAYAIGALTEDEMRKAEDHLRACANHPDVHELQAVAMTLGAAAREMEPPPALKSRLMDAIRADIAGSAPAAMRLARTARRGPWETIRSWFTGGRAPLALGGVAAAVAVIVLAIVIASPGGDEGSGKTLVANLAGEATGTLTYDPDERTAQLTLVGVAAPPSGQVYQMWVITDAGPESLGVVPVSGDRVEAEMEGLELAPAQTVAFTLEPAPDGSLQPTSEPVISGELS